MIRRAVAAAGEPPRGISVQFRGQIPPLDLTISGLRVGLLLAVAGDFSAALRQFPVAAPGARHRPDRAGGAVRRPADAARHRHHAQHPVLHGRHHGHRDRRGQFDSAGHVRGARAP